MSIAMMSRSAPQIITFLVLLTLSTGLSGSNSGVGKPKISCKEAERRALLSIKEDLYWYSSSFKREAVDSLLPSWGKEEGKAECCEWIGIRCDNKSGHVIALDLSRSTLGMPKDTSISGTQLQTRDATAYLENPELCGAPLLTKCLDEEPTISHDVHDGQEEDKYITKGFYASIAVGFVVGLWGVCGALIFNKSLRYGYFKMLDTAENWINKSTAVHRAKLLMRIRG